LFEGLKLKIILSGHLKTVTVMVFIDLYATITSMSFTDLLLYFLPMFVIAAAIGFYVARLIWG